MIPELQAERQRVEHVFELARTSAGSSDEALAHWARYLCVLTSGLIESGVRLILSEYVRKRAATEVAAFVIGKLDRLTNLNATRVEETLGEFSGRWRLSFEQNVSDAQKDAINSTVANRHLIVHGRPVGVTFVAIKEFYKKAWEVLQWLHEEVLGP